MDQTSQPYQVRDKFQHSKTSISKTKDKVAKVLEALLQAWVAPLLATFQAHPMSLALPPKLKIHQYLPALTTLSRELWVLTSGGQWEERQLLNRLKIDSRRSLTRKTKE